MKIKLSILFFIFPLLLFAQAKISGRVLDKETEDPVPNVVIYTNSNKITQTDDEGRYNLVVNQSEPVYFRQLTYDLFVGSSDSLLLNPNVYLTRNIIYLNEVVISPNDAQNLLNKAIQNLYMCLQKNKTRSYLYHIEETTDTGGNREAYASVNAELSKINIKKGFLDWNINLIQLDKKVTLENSFRHHKSPIIRVELFPQRMAINSELNNYICTFYDDDDNQLIIKASPKQLDKKHYRYYMYTINKQDTILTEYISQSLSNSSGIVIQKILNQTRQMLNHFSSLIFVQDELSDSYYLKEMHHIGAHKITMGSLSCVFSFRISSKEISINPFSEKKEIKPFDYILFETDFPETPDFWKQYVK